MSQTFKIDNGDIVISRASGKPTTISDALKLRQDISEFFTVNIQPNGFGAGIEQLVGLVSESANMFTGLVHRQILDGFSTFKSLQQSNLNIPRPTTERISDVTYIAVEQDLQDPTRFYFRVNISTESGVELPFSSVLTA